MGCASWVIILCLFSFQNLGFSCPIVASTKICIQIRNQSYKFQVKVRFRSLYYLRESRRSYSEPTELTLTLPLTLSVMEGHVYHTEGLHSVCDSPELK